MSEGESMANQEGKMGTIKKVYILHGWAYSTDKWQQFIKLLKENNIDSEVLNIPGLTEKTDNIWTLEDYVEWLKKTLGSEEAVVIGHSNGGRIALAFALKYPEKLKQLILIDSAGIYHNELPIRLKRLVFRTLAKIGKKITTSEKIRSLLYKAARESDYKNATPQMRQTMVNMITSDLTSELEKISVPTLIVWGKYDKSTPLKDGELMHSRIKNSKFIIISNARHSPQFTNTKEVCEIIMMNL